jgi:hypothetical protein
MLSNYSKKQCFLLRYRGVKKKVQPLSAVPFWCVYFVNLLSHYLLASAACAAASLAIGTLNGEHET